jgi:biotin operon repressor
MTLLDALTTTPQVKRVLAEKLGVPTREVEALVQQARLDGVPIVSSSDGYWLGTPAEVADCAERLRNRAIHQLLTARALRRAARPRQWTLGL